jgi:ketosteroid isomerase-like protein
LAPPSADVRNSGKIAQARAAYDAWSRRDLEAFVAEFSEDVELQPFLGRGLGSTVYHGHDGLRRWYSEANEEWEELAVDAHDFLERGDQLVVFLKAVGRGRGSHVEVEAEIVHVAEYHDGKFTRLRGFRDRSSALEALEALEARD